MINPQRPTDTAFISGSQTVTYAELGRRVNAAAARLDVSPGDRVAIFSENRIEWAFAFLAAWVRGCIPVPIDCMAAADEVAHILDDCEPAALFFTEGTRKVLEAAGNRHRPALLRVEELTEEGSDDPYPDFPRDRTAVIIYTSGTTGSPKGVMLSFGNLESNLKTISTDTGIFRHDDRVLVLLPMHHILPLQGSLLATLYLGATAVFCPSMASEDILNTLARHRITMIVGVPRLFTLIRNGLKSKVMARAAGRVMFRLCRAVNSLTFSRLLFRPVQKRFGGCVRYMPCGGAAIDEDVVRDFRTFGFEILTGYGMTETAPIISFTRPGGHRAGAAGQVMEANRVRIVDGEITVSGPNVMQGYYRRPEETADILRDGWIYTGDLGHVDEDGYVFITGRRKEILVLPNGKNINPAEIEAKLCAMSPVVAEAGVVLADGVLKALIYPNFTEVSHANILNIREHLARHVLDAYNRQASPAKRVMAFSPVREPLPKTRLGKLKRHELASLAEEDRSDRAPGPEPDSEEYRIIRDFLAGQSRKTVFPDDHLEIDLALDSLDKVSLQVFLQSTFGVSLDEDGLIAYPTPAKLAEHVCETKTGVREESLKWGEILRRHVDVSLPRSGFTHVAINRLARWVFSVYLPVRESGLENLPTGPFILAPNHQSALDGLFITMFMRTKLLKDTFFYAKADHLRRRWLRFLADTHNVIIVDINRDLQQSLHKLAEALKAGKNIVIFPEGTRSRDGGLGRFRKTFAILGSELQVPIVPVAISGAGRALPAGKILPRPFRRVQVSFLPPVYPESDSYATLVDRVQAAVRGALPEAGAGAS